ncbi:MAG: hypothetical protein ACI9R3_003260 [Verrucomicrobiales bacterium]|jgi:hypothetical protein
MTSEGCPACLARKKPAVKSVGMKRLRDTFWGFAIGVLLITLTAGWNHEERAQVSPGPWPHNLTTLRLAPSASRYERLVPKDERHRKGFELFRKSCMVWPGVPRCCLPKGGSQ